jgi:hypothetical protein
MAAQAGRSAEKIRVAHHPIDDMFLQHVHSPFVAGQIPVAVHKYSGGRVGEARIETTKL